MISKLALLAAVLLTAQTPAPDAAGPPAAAVRRRHVIEMSVQVLDRKGEIPRALKAEDFTIVEAASPARRPPWRRSPSPWRIVIYVDRVLTGSRTLRAAAGPLAERRRRWPPWVPWRSWWPSPCPAWPLAATRERPGHRRGPLQALARRARGGTMSASCASVSGTPEKEAGSIPGAGDAEAIEVEARLVRRQQDALTEWLVAQEGDGPRASSW